MVQDHPIWQRLREKTVYKGRMHIIEHDVILPNGEGTTYELEHSDGTAVAVLIKTPDDKLF